MKILLLTRYGYLGASSRYRSYQYLPYLKKLGFEFTVAPLLDNAYLERLPSGKGVVVSAISRAYTQRVWLLLQSQKYDLIWLEKEAFPWIPALLESLLFNSGVPYLVDYDDALFHRYDQHKSSLIRQVLGKKIDSVMRRAALVLAGNDYLAQRAHNAGAPRVEILPTVIDLERYPIAQPPNNSQFTIGWIGSPSTSRYLKEIHPALQEICRDGTTKVVAVGATPLELPGVPLEIKPWSESTEVEEMQQFDVGIMPLTDTPWEKGKCGFKLIQYMACVRPVIGSPVGVNQQIINQGINGFLSSSREDWIKAFQILKQNQELRERMGKAGRVMVEEKYCLQKTLPDLANFLRSTASHC
ncbi:MAG TPA: glycosyltransferase family 4 protein [Oculatellaceae cyanobacterium]|jgi:glycosyltransferase involved in cell wall biosynthesis